MRLIWITLILSCISSGFGDTACKLRKGICQYTSVTCNQGTWTSGLCNGPSNRKCCKPVDPKCVAQSGTCQYQSLTSCSGSYQSGLCYGPADRKCCVPSPGGAAPSKNADKKCTDIPGKCQYASSSTCTGGYLSGKCSGSADRKCCVSASECTVTQYGNSNWFIGKDILADKAFHKDLNTIKGYAKACGVQVYITHSWRKSGSGVNGAIVQPASSSNHLVGHAIDFNLRRTSDNRFCNSVCLKAAWRSRTGTFYCFLNKVHQDSGLRWGGVWGTPDPVHIDDHTNSNKAKYRALRDKLQAACAKI